MRQDYLEQVGLERPETIDEWEQMLIAFRDQLGLETPLTLKDNSTNAYAFVGAYGITKQFFLKDGTVVYGPMTDEYEQYINLMAKWVREGLLGPGFCHSRPPRPLMRRFPPVKAGAYVGSVWRRHGEIHFRHQRAKSRGENCEL